MYLLDILLVQKLEVCEKENIRLRRKITRLEKLIKNIGVKNE